MFTVIKQTFHTQSFIEHLTESKFNVQMFTVLLMTLNTDAEEKKRKTKNEKQIAKPINKKGKEKENKKSIEG